MMNKFGIFRSCPSATLDSPCTWSIKTDLVTFQLGLKVEDLTMDVRSIKNVFTMPSWNRLVEEQVGATVNTSLVRDFFKDKIDHHVCQ